MDLETLSPEERARLGVCPRCGGHIDPEATTCGWCQRASSPEERVRAAPPPKQKADLATLVKNAGVVPKRWLLLPALGAHLFALCWLHFWVAPPLAYAAERGQTEMVHGGRAKRRVELPAAEVAAYHRLVPKARLRGIVSVAILALGFLLALWFPFTGTLLGAGLDLVWTLGALAAWPGTVALHRQFMSMFFTFELLIFLFTILYALSRGWLYLQIRKKLKDDPYTTPDVEY